MKLFYKCTFFDDNFVPKDNFSIAQYEISLKNTLSNQRSSFTKKEIEYKCKWESAESFDHIKPCVLIPIKDHLELLKKTIKNLVDNDMCKIANIVIIDDRSSNDIKSVLDQDMSYLRVDNNNGFNFSMLNNIAAKICHSLGAKEIVLWNADLWTPNKTTFPRLLKKHRDESCSLSGTKLIYPPKKMSLRGEEDTKNIRDYFPSMLNGRWRETIQFGGDVFFNNSFHHYGRFLDKNDYRVNVDRPSNFITGAFQIINLDDFIEVGGLNPSLSKNYQDVDLCMKMLSEDKKVYYFGKSCHMYHDESALMCEEKKNKGLLSDSVLFNKIWKADEFLRIVVP